jgi:hypothetical protein
MSFSTAVPLPDGDAPEHIAHAIFDALDEASGRMVSAVDRRMHAYSVKGGFRWDGAARTIH